MRKGFYNLGEQLHQRMLFLRQNQTDPTTIRFAYTGMADRNCHSSRCQSWQVEKIKNSPVHFFLSTHPISPFTFLARFEKNSRVLNRVSEQHISLSRAFDLSYNISIQQKTTSGISIEYEIIAHVNITQQMLCSNNRCSVCALNLGSFACHPLKCDDGHNCKRQQQ